MVEHLDMAYPSLVAQAPHYFPIPNYTDSKGMVPYSQTLPSVSTIITAGGWLHHGPIAYMIVQNTKPVSPISAPPAVGAKGRNRILEGQTPEGKSEAQAELTQEKGSKSERHIVSRSSLEQAHSLPAAATGFCFQLFSVFLLHLQYVLLL
jgi:hypothetical protein